METNLFNFDTCDGNVEEMTYFDVTLNSPVGKFQSGEKFGSAKLNMDKGELSLYSDDSCAVIVGKYRVGLCVLSDMMESE